MANSKVRKIYEELKSHDWLFFKTPTFTNRFETRFEWGNIDLIIYVEVGKIKDG